MWDFPGKGGKILGKTLAERDAEEDSAVSHQQPILNSWGIEYFSSEARI